MITHHFREKILLKNVLEELGVPKDRVGEVLGLITEEADRLGFLTDIKGEKYVSLSDDSAPNTATQDSIPPQNKRKCPTQMKHQKPSRHQKYYSDCKR